MSRRPDDKRESNADGCKEKSEEAHREESRREEAGTPHEAEEEISFLVRAVAEMVRPAPAVHTQRPREERGLF